MMIDKIYHLTPEEEKRVTTIKSIVALYTPENIDAVENITNIALNLAYLFEKWYLITRREEFWLYYASLLHAIGSSEGTKKYHIRTQNIILDLRILPFSPQERLIIGCIARYHRKALPSIRHPHFSALSPDQQNSVKWMSAYLRLAVDLHNHNLFPSKTTKSKREDSIVLICKTNLPYIKSEEPRIKQKDLLEHLLGKMIKLKFEPSLSLTA